MKISNFIIKITLAGILSMCAVAFGQTSYTTNLKAIQSSYTYGAKTTKTQAYHINYVNVVTKVNGPSYMNNSYVSTVAEDFIKQTSAYNKQSGLFIGFDHLKTIKLHPISEELLESWETENYAIYYTDAKFQTFSYEEYDSHKKLIKSCTHTIITHSEDDEVHTLVVRSLDNNSVYRAFMWKDGSMIALESSSGIYLVTGEYEILRF